MATPMYIDGIAYFKITDVAEMIGVHPNTLRLWDESRAVPEPFRYGEKGIRYWSQKDIAILRAYKEQAKYGQLACVTRGKRGAKYLAEHDNLPRTKSLAYYHKVFDFKTFLEEKGFTETTLNIDPISKSCIVIADNKVFRIPFDLLEKEDVESIKQYLNNRLVPVTA
jgi:hypothetical protein